MAVMSVMSLCNYVSSLIVTIIVLYSSCVVDKLMLVMLLCYCASCPIVSVVSFIYYAEYLCLATPSPSFLSIDRQANKCTDITDITAYYAENNMFWRQTRKTQKMCDFSPESRPSTKKTQYHLGLPNTGQWQLPKIYKSGTRSYTVLRKTSTEC